MQAQLDVHTHTIASGHAYATITEMAQAASQKGLKLLGITEHAKGIPGTCDNFYFVNLGVLPRKMFGIDVMFGSEINIIDYEGNLSLEQRFINCLDLRIAGIHRFCYRYGTEKENTHAVVGAIANPEVDIISHPDDSRTPLDYERVVYAAREHHTLLEINNNSFRSKTRKNVFENTCRILELCKNISQPVIMGSDAHYITDLACFDLLQDPIKAVGFPNELIMNYSVEQFKVFIDKNKEHRQAQ